MCPTQKMQNTPPKAGAASAPPRVGFVGLGAMGFPMAGHLSRAGFSVYVYNRTQQKVARWLEEYVGFSAPTPAAAVEKADIVFTCVGNDESLQEVLLGDLGGFNGASQGTLFVDHTTVSAKVSRELAPARGRLEWRGEAVVRVDARRRRPRGRPRQRRPGVRRRN